MKIFDQFMIKVQLKPVQGKRIQTDEAASFCESQCITLPEHHINTASLITNRLHY